jgi:hypothetical protein
MDREQPSSPFRCAIYTAAHERLRLKAHLETLVEIFTVECYIRINGLDAAWLTVRHNSNDYARTESFFSG